ncbi:hypothetical protein CR513_22508, partial [Mucuna pruriens]
MRYLLNSKVRNFIMCALIEYEYEKFHSCKYSKEISYLWKNLGTLKVHEIELSKDERQGKGKSITLKAQKSTFLMDKDSSKEYNPPYSLATPIVLPIGFPSEVELFLKPFPITMAYPVLELPLSSMTD